jgi:Uma2 family endonuclease
MEGEVMSARPKKRITPEEYLAYDRQSEGRSEYNNGEVIPMPGGTSNHSRICVNLNRRIDEQLDGSPCYPLDCNMRIRIPSANSYRYADVIVVCGEILHEGETKDILLNPTVVVEVLSPSTERQDRTTKLFQYQQIPSLKEIIYVEQDEPIVHRYVRQNDGTWSSNFFAGITASLELASMKVSIPLVRVYDRVQFPEPTVEQESEPA